MRILIILHHRFELWNAPPWFAERLASEFPDTEVTHLSSYKDLEVHLGEAEVLVAWSLRPEQLRLAPKLRWIHSPAAAVHQLISPELIESGVALTNAREVHGPVVGEHVIALILALAKQLPAAVRLQGEHRWGQEALWTMRPRVREVAGATLGLVGLGAIGRETAKRAGALGMRVVATREHPEKVVPEHVAEVLPASQLEWLLRESDYVVLAAPLTPGTRGLMAAPQFAWMRKDACLINVGRGPLVDEVALHGALRDHTIGGAALDVFREEPLPKDSPLWDLENILITPHSAGLTDKLWERHYRLFTANLRRYLNQEPLSGMVDQHRGY